MHVLLQALCSEACVDHPVLEFKSVEWTHPSCVLLTGLFAYQFKKPLNLGFLDFRSLEQRKYYLHEEYG